MIRRLSIIIAVASGFFMMLQYFSGAEAPKVLYRALLDYYQIIFAATMVVGGITLLRHHIAKVKSVGTESFYSVATVAATLFMVVAALIYGTGTGSPYQWAFQNLQAPMQSTIFALLAFFVASAAYRGFRVRSRPALALIIAALILLIGKSAFGELISRELSSLAGWVLNTPSAAAKRGILIGVGLASVATALRVILGIERSYL